MTNNSLYNITIQQIKNKFGINYLDSGLDSNQVEERLKTIGLNKIPDNSGYSVLSLFLEQFKDFMVLVLIGAIIISGFLGEFDDAIAILAIVILNAIMGFVQEVRAERSLQALKELSAPQAKVLREGSIEEVPSQELVPGDIILVEMGDKIPADARIIKENNLKVNEASLTGESMAVNKENTTLQGKVAVGDRKNMIHMGTIVTKGRAEAIVTATGTDTEMGKIADLLQQSEDNKTPLQERLNDLGQWLVLICFIACVAVVGLGVIKGESIYKMFLAGVSLAVAAIPEGLPAIVTLSLAIGVQRMIKRNAIIRKLPAVETLGCATVICSDKTGTLTKNEMTVQQIYTIDQLFNCQVEGFDNPRLKRILEIGTICNNARLKRGSSLSGKINEVKDYVLGEESKKEVVGDPTEAALLLAADKVGLKKEDLRAEFSKVLEVPFSSSRKRMSIIGKKRGEYELFIKGAPDVLLERCSNYIEDGQVKKLTSRIKNKIIRQNEGLANQALRVLAVGYRKLGSNIDQNNLEKYENNIIFVGLVGMIDPPRDEVKSAIIDCKKAGIIPKMVTGDHKNTAVAIAKQLELLNKGDQVVTGKELSQMSDQKLKEQIDDIAVFARVAPEDKLRIVKILQEKGHVVAMTGDGVNDAPAVKEADIGIAMGEKGTDVTKEASALILADDNFATIVAAIEEGRAIYDNIRKFIRYLLSCNIGEILAMFLTSLLGLPLPLLPIQILWVNLVTDGLPALALGVDPADDDIMERQPRDKEESVFAHGLKWKIGARGVLIALGTVLVFLFGIRFTDSLLKARTLAFTNLVMAQLFFVFSCRSEEHSLLRINPLSNIYLLGAVAFSFGMHYLVLHLPFLQEIFNTTVLSRGEWGLIILVSGGSTLLIELVQFVTNLFRKNISLIDFKELISKT
ncbi:calcium-translocating P-type ATPase, SERCA-type [Natroniella sulfidigena]|uniref:calcium-translocating P-type ATPase, SERCA-type n=1 Tax=Natroniella sulfidigena TaxID=723921 RepID=UPI00200B8067|nr:calcium-translocating P-type ATPase, SERCA-type [Natroniella sulfidigena]MCK8817784.1 calcium-translocating P-type ATPase, SERCA-type [Natroniella sulfidigena]